MVRYPLPPAFADGGKAIPAGAVVLTYPLAMGPTADAELWQAEDNFRFSLVGGYFSGPGPNGRATYRSGETELDALLITYLLTPHHAPLTVTPAAVAAARQDLRSGGVTTIVVDTDWSHAGSAVTLFERALGSQPAQVGSDRVFYNVRSELAVDPVTSG